MEHLVSELSEIQPESHLHVRLYQEMALLNIDLAMLNMCNIYNIHADDTYKLCALSEIQTHINHIFIVSKIFQLIFILLNMTKSMNPISRKNLSSGCFIPYFCNIPSGMSQTTYHP